MDYLGFSNLITSFLGLRFPVGRAHTGIRLNIGKVVGTLKKTFFIGAFSFQFGGKFKALSPKILRERGVFVYLKVFFQGYRAGGLNSFFFFFVS